MLPVWPHHIVTIGFMRSHSDTWPLRSNRCQTLAWIQKGLETPEVEEFTASESFQLQTINFRGHTEKCETCYCNFFSINKYGIRAPFLLMNRCLTFVSTTSGPKSGGLTLRRVSSCFWKMVSFGRVEFSWHRSTSWLATIWGSMIIRWNTIKKD